MMYVFYFIIIIILFVLILIVSLLFEAIKHGGYYRREAFEPLMEAFPNGAYLYVTFEKSKLVKITKRRDGCLCKKYNNDFMELEGIENIRDIKLIFDKLDNFVNANDADKIRVITDTGVARATS